MVKDKVSRGISPVNAGGEVIAVREFSRAQHKEVGQT
jgi:hypothetical protein